MARAWWPLSRSRTNRKIDRRRAGALIIRPQSIHSQSAMSGRDNGEPQGGASEVEPERERGASGFCHGEGELIGFCHGFATVGAILARFCAPGQCRMYGKWFKIREASDVGA
jgi:hypothetical protein